ncbi:MAG: glycosyltransferase family 2 protein [Candidatus Dormibacteria bacterium]
MVSVLVPTFHRPGLLSEAVEAVLAQELPEGVALETIICVSDPSNPEDVAAATALAADPRVRVALGPAQGPAGSRNAGMREARGDVLAFTDDDCRPRPEWIARALAALEGADMVQGLTRPAGPVPPWHHSVTAVPPTWRWETSNLVVTREMAERTGPFSTEFWTGGMPYGEDVEWGWRAVRLGARAAFTSEAVVEHAVSRRGPLATLRYYVLQGRYAQVVARVPEARQSLAGGTWIDPRHRFIAAGLAAAIISAGLATTGRGRPARAAAGLAGAAMLSANAGLIRGVGEGIGTRAMQEAAQFAGCVYGSIRWRRLLL